LEWYAGHSQTAAARFAQAVEVAVAEIKNGPQLWPSISRRLRYRKLRRFPYCLFYRVIGNTAFIVAVAHGRRRLGYWKRRK
jgi:plasmid stabilization system protein ParE